MNHCSIALLRFLCAAGDVGLFEIIDEINFLNQASGTYDYV